MSEELSDFDEEEIREFIEDELEGKNELSAKQARDSHGRFKSKASLARAAAAAAVAANTQGSTAEATGEGNGPEERKVYRTRKRKAYY
ncbi:hypothetical protein KEM55_000890 [Ascosphaera atra]|nr:hypothetical protein KEM55_000890 [Ascosphaera atra]